ncbi:MAG: ATPase, T2SS/T4P/T4SS family [Planctomycetaceae bacterium]
MTSTPRFATTLSGRTGARIPMPRSSSPLASNFRDTAAEMPLGEALIAAGLLRREDLEGTLTRQSSSRRRLGELLIEMGLIEEDKLLPFLGERLGLHGVRLREGLIDPEIVRLIPRQVAERLCVLAMFRVHQTLTVAMADPQNLLQVDELERLTGCRVNPVLALRSSIEKILPRCYEDDYQVDDVTAGIDDASVEIQSDVVRVDLDNIAEQADGSPIVSLVNYILVHAIRQGASDIHIEAGRRHSSVRFRVDGQLREVLRPRSDFHAALISRIKVMSRMDIAEHRRPQDGRVHVIVEGKEIDLRASTLPTVLGEKMVLRVLDSSNLTFRLADLGVPPAQMKQFEQMLRRPHGLVLVTGPTGSGKTTTLYSALELIKSVHSNIVTVEDPVEYSLEMVNQVHASQGSTVTFASALRAILRQDPDVIMIGEIRDAETAEIAIQAALTGHLVLSTLHTNDSAGAITRLRDMGIAMYKISAALVGVVAQRLVRCVCPKCRTNYFPGNDVLDRLGFQGDRRRQFAKGEGCPNCFDTGFRGRNGIYEVLTVTSDLRDLMTQDISHQTIRKWYRQHGGQFLLEQGLALAEKGVTSPEEVLRVAGGD